MCIIYLLDCRVFFFHHIYIVHILQFLLARCYHEYTTCITGFVCWRYTSAKKVYIYVRHMNNHVLNTLNSARLSSMALCGLHRAAIPSLTLLRLLIVKEPSIALSLCTKRFVDTSLSVYEAWNGITNGIYCRIIEWNIYLYVKPTTGFR